MEVYKFFNIHTFKNSINKQIFTYHAAPFFEYTQESKGKSVKSGFNPYRPYFPNYQKRAHQATGASVE